MSRMRILSLLLFVLLLSPSLCALVSGSRVSSTGPAPTPDALPRLLFTPPVALRPPLPTEFRDAPPLFGAGGISGTDVDGCSIANGSGYCSFEGGGD